MGYGRPYDPGTGRAVPFRQTAMPVTASEPTRVVGVKRVVEFIANLLKRNSNLRELSVRGEVTNLKVVNGTHYFDLKEGDALLASVGWAKDSATFPSFTNGTLIVASGEVLAYGGKSKYQLIVRTVVIDGVGNVHAQFAALKLKLERDGAFDPTRKRAIPKYPFHVALVSSKRADGAIDFATILRRRAPHVRITWCETSVQGPAASLEIARAIDRAGRLSVDVIVITRGGGSFEDLFAFSAEAVVRAIRNTSHPVISAVGHTVNQQLCDFAADHHTETPSAAAECVSDETGTLLLDLREDVLRVERKVRARITSERALLERLQRQAVLGAPQRFLDTRRGRLESRVRDVDEAARARVATFQRRLSAAERRLAAQSPAQRLEGLARRLAVARYRLDSAAATLTRHDAERIASLAARLAPAVARVASAAQRAHHRAEGRLEPAFVRTLDRKRERLAVREARLDGRDPEAILDRGYAIVTIDGRIVRDPAAAPPGTLVQAQLAHGTLHARVEPAP